MTAPYRQSLTEEQVLRKLKHYCAYQERCHQEARDKIYSFGLNKNDVEKLIAQLIEEDYLNEERFAIQYSGGKFRMNEWGRIKIRHALQQKKVSEYCIKKALTQIDEEDYEKTLQKLTQSKWNTLKGEKNILIKKRKLQGYLLQKGFEAALIDDVMRLMCK